MPELLWIGQSYKGTRASYEEEALKRQHVMINHLNKVSASDAPPVAPERSLQSPTAAWHYATPPPEPEHRPKNDEKSRTRKQAAAIPIRGRVSGMQVKRFSKQPKPAPSKALLNTADQEIYQAAWFHAAQPAFRVPSELMSWWNCCRIDWNHSFWHFAQRDETMLEVFMTFAAAKEAAMKSTDVSSGYYVHKGKALNRVMHDIQREGPSLRVAAVCAISMLCKAAFVEEDYESAQKHVDALTTLVSPRSCSISPFFWLFLIVWSDLRMTAVSSRAPAFPFRCDPDFCTRLPDEAIVRAETLAGCRESDLPQHGIFDAYEASRVLRHLYLVAAVYNNAATDRVAAWTVMYETAYYLAQLESNFQHATWAGGQSERNLAHVTITTARVQFWTTCALFVPQRGLQRHLLDVFVRDTSKTTPEDICDKWEAKASVDSLLWTLFNVCTIIIYRNATGDPATPATSKWLRSAMALVIDRLGLRSCEDFKRELRRWPFTETWSSKMCRPVYNWVTTGVLKAQRPLNASEGLLGRYTDFRLTFDPFEDDKETAMVYR